MDEIQEFIANTNCPALSKHDIDRKLRIIKKRQDDAKALAEAEKAALIAKLAEEDQEDE